MADRGPFLKPRGATPNPMKAQTNDYYRLLAAQYVRKQVKQLRSQFEGVRRAENVEFVHHARVASRRLRAAIRMFSDCFPRKMLKRWGKGIRRLTEELGEARDKDVQIGLLTDQLGRIANRDQSPGITRLLVKLELAREALQPQVLKAIDRLETSGVLEEMNSQAKAMMPEEDASIDEAQGRVLFRQMGEQILDRFEEFLAHEDSLARPEDQASHHAMRIAAKRLRYTMEICRPAYDGRLDAFLAAVKEVQGLLGEIHDCDVWVEQLEAFLDEERKRIVASYGHDAPVARLRAGIDFLRQERQQHRCELFQRLVDYWQELQRQKFWAGLTQAVYTPVETPPDLCPPQTDQDDSGKPVVPAQTRKRKTRTKESKGAPQRRGEPAEDEPPPPTVGS